MISNNPLSTTYISLGTCRYISLPTPSIRSYSIHYLTDYPTTAQHSTAPLQPPSTTTRKKRIPWHTSSSPIHLHSPPRSGRERIKSQFASQKLYFHQFHTYLFLYAWNGRTCGIQDQQDKTATVGGTSYIKRLFLEDGRDYDMLSCPALPTWLITWYLRQKS